MTSLHSNDTAGRVRRNAVSVAGSARVSPPASASAPVSAPRAPSVGAASVGAASAGKAQVPSRPAGSAGVASVAPTSPPVSLPPSRARASASATVTPSQQRPRNYTAGDRATEGRDEPLRPRSHRRGARRKSDRQRDTAGYVEDSMVRKTIRGFGEILITCGLVILLFAAFEVWGKAWMVAQDQERLTDALEQQWEEQRTNPRNQDSGGETDNPSGVQDGDALTRMHIPAMDKKWVIVEGVTLKDIKLAPGHYPDTALPGQPGNFSIAGHRTPVIFWDLDNVSDGDAIVLEDADNYYIYEVYKTHIVKPNDTWVVAPDPDNPSSTNPTRTLLTITTCNPKLDNYERLVVHAEIYRTQAKSDGKPSELR